MRIKKNQLRSMIRKVLLESTGGMTVGELASQYPDLWEDLCDVRDYDMQGYQSGSPMMNKPLGEFIREERLNTDDTYWWRDYYANSFQKAQLCVEVLAGEVGWERLSYSGLDFDACYQLTAKACEEFGIPVPEHLEDKAYHMDDHQAMDAALGADWMSSFRDKFDLD